MVDSLPRPTPRFSPPLKCVCREPFDQQRLREYCFICQPTVFFRAALFHDIGPLDPTLKYCLDYEYWLWVAQRARIAHLNEYLANARLQMEAKTVAHPVQALEEALRVVQRYYHEVPASWLHSYATFRLRAALMPNLQGIDTDGWAARRVRLVLHGGWRHLVVHLKGVVPPAASPLSVRVAVNDHMLHETVLPAGPFTVTTSCSSTALGHTDHQVSELTIHTDRSVPLPHARATSGDRLRSYQLHHFSVRDEQGHTLVCYTTARGWLFSILKPLLFLGKFMLTNRRVPWTELQQGPGVLWRALKKMCTGPRTIR